MKSVDDGAFGDLRRDLVLLLPRLRRFAHGLTGAADQADDLVQEACEKALRNAEKWQPGTSLDSWLYRIIQNTWRDQLRSGHRRYMSAAPPNPAGPTADAATETEARLTLRAVSAAMQQLNDNQRAVVMLVCVEGCSYAEAAGILGWPVGTVMSRLARARLALYDIIEKDNGPSVRKRNKGRKAHA